MGVLKARVGGAWVEVSQGGSEVEVSATDPIAANPAAEVWYDTTDTGQSLVNMPQIESGSYTPTLTGMAIGTGGSPGALNVASYQFLGIPGVGGRGMLFLEGVVRFGATSITLPTGAVSMGLPTGFNFGSTYGAPIGWCWITSSGVDVFAGTMSINTVSSVMPYTWVGTPATAPIWPRRGNFNATSPMTWKANDQITWSASLPAVRV